MLLCISDPPSFFVGSVFTTGHWACQMSLPWLGSAPLSAEPPASPPPSRDVSVDPTRASQAPLLSLFETDAVKPHVTMPIGGLDWGYSPSPNTMSQWSVRPQRPITRHFRCPGATADAPWGLILCWPGVHSLRHDARGRGCAMEMQMYCAGPGTRGFANYHHHRGSSSRKGKGEGGRPPI